MIVKANVFSAYLLLSYEPIAKHVALLTQEAKMHFFNVKTISKAIKKVVNVQEDLICHVN